MKPRAIFAAVALALVVSACTVTPDRVSPGSASYDNGEANSGVLSLEKTGAIVTPRLVERYRALLEVYRAAFVPKVDPAAGVLRNPDGTYFISNEVLERLILLSDWRRMGRKPD